MEAADERVFDRDDVVQLVVWARLDGFSADGHEVGDGHPGWNLCAAFGDTPEVEGPLVCRVCFKSELLGAFHTSQGLGAGDWVYEVRGAGCCVLAVSAQGSVAVWGRGAFWEVAEWFGGAAPGACFLHTSDSIIYDRNLLEKNSRYSRKDTGWGGLETTGSVRIRVVPLTGSLFRSPQ